MSSKWEFYLRRLLFETISGCLPNQDSNTNSAMKWKFRYMDDWLRVSIDVCLHRSATCTHSCVQLHRLKSCSLGGINAPGSLVLINITMKMFPVLRHACLSGHELPVQGHAHQLFLTFLTASPSSPSSEWVFQCELQQLVEAQMFSHHPLRRDAEAASF